MYTSRHNLTSGIDRISYLHDCNSVVRQLFKDSYCLTNHRFYFSLFHYSYFQGRNHG